MSGADVTVTRDYGAEWRAVLKRRLERARVRELEAREQNGEDLYEQADDEKRNRESWEDE